MQPPSKVLRLPVLLDQQFWVLGHDIRHSDGNALQRFGFARWRSADASGTTCYLFEEPDADPLVCWGFGAYCGPVVRPTAGTQAALTPSPAGTTSGVVLQRHASAPRLSTTPVHMPLHRLNDLPRTRSATTAREWELIAQGVLRLAALFARYEHWARGALGQDYRLRTLRELPRHKRRRFDRSPDLSAHWGEFSASYAVL